MEAIPRGVGPSFSMSAIVAPPFVKGTFGILKVK
jgi:hypothetical protein